MDITTLAGAGPYNLSHIHTLEDGVLGSNPEMPQTLS
jgi:hypothetical protein